MSQFIETINATNGAPTLVNVNHIAFLQKSVALEGTVDLFIDLGTENCVLKIKADFDDLVVELDANKQQSCCNPKGE